jgi:hypothetical protein
MPTDSDPPRHPNKPSLWQFYKAVWLQAIKGKLEYARGWQTLAALAIGLAGTVASPFIPGGWSVVSGALTVVGWVPFLAFLGGFLWALIRDLTRAPHQLYLAQADKAEAAEAIIRDLQREPDSVCAFVDPGDLVSSSALNKSPSATVHRVALRNLSQTTEIVGVEITLLRYVDLQTGATVQIGRLLQDIRGHSVAAITPGAVRHFNAIVVRPDKSPARVYFAPWAEGSPFTAGPGQYRLDVEAVTASSLPVPASFLLTVDGGGKVKLTISSVN